MKRFWLTASAAAILVLGAGSLWLHAQYNDTRPLASLLPPGALWYVEAKDFGKVLREWNRSAEKIKWVASDNFKILAQSRLVQRLAQAQDEFVEVAGVPVDMGFADQVAGQKSAFAFYDLSHVVFVYLTQRPESALEGMDLWKGRSQYEARATAGIPFYVKKDEKGVRTVAFASYKDWFVLSTNEDRMAQTLALLSGQKAGSIATEDWYSDAASQQAAGDLRLVCNLTPLVLTPQFRTYWVQRNVSEVKTFRSSVSDLFERKDGFEEQRVLLRKTEAEADTSPNSSAVAEVLRYATPDSSLYRAWANPDSAVLKDVLLQVIFGEPVSANPLYNPMAPTVNAEAAAVGSETDLETRIDEAPFVKTSSASPPPLAAAILKMEPTALLHVQTTAALQDQVFVMPASGAVIICRKPDLAALQAALTQTSSALQTGSLDPLRVSVNGNAILLTRIELRPTAAQPKLNINVAYTAAYHRAFDWPRYQKLLAVIDRTAVSPEMQQSQSMMPFFSRNVQSLGESWSRLQRVSIVSEDTPGSIRETVRYDVSQP
jgi:hypothetical protein